MCPQSPSPIRIAAVLPAAMLSVATAQQPDRPVFRSETAIVEVTVIVRDRSGAFVPDLTIEDFEVFEGDVPQKVETLYTVRPPASDRGLEAALVPTSSSRSAARTFVFLFDIEHTSPGGLTRARDAVAKFATERLATGDLAAAIAVGGTSQGAVSTDRRAFAESLARLKPRGDAQARTGDLRQWPRLNEPEALEIANGDAVALKRVLDRACSEQVHYCFPDVPSAAGAEGAIAKVEADLRMKAQTFVQETRAAAQRSIATLDRIARALDTAPGRKTIVWITEGTFSDEVREQTREVSYRAAQSGVTIYGLDPRGLARRTAGALDTIAPTDTGMDVLLAAAEDPAELLAVGSGGFVIRDENRLDRALRRIEDDTSTYYVVGYAPSEGVDRAGFNPLRVRVRRPGVHVRARHGYMAPSRAVTTPAAGSRAIEPRRVENVLSGRESLPIETMVAASAVNIRSAVEASAAPARATLRLRPDAEKRVREIAGGDPAREGWLPYRGWEAYQRGDVETAIDAFTRAAAEKDARPWVVYALGLAQAALARYADAAASWERVRQAAPDFETVYMDLADAYVQVRDYTKALQVLRESESRWPSNPDVHNAVGVIHIRRGALDRAIDAFARAAAVAPGEGLAHFNLGRAYEMRFVRSRRYVSSQQRWVGSDEDRQKAAEHYARYVELGGPYAREAHEALSRLEWVRAP